MSEYKKVPTNTQREAQQDPVIRAVGPLLANQARYVDIPAQERKGQQELVDSDVLPVAMHTPRERFEALGFVFGDAVPDDPIFRLARLPVGWKREASDHDMWSYVVDGRGVRRVAVFYKAAYYDRNAFMRVIDVGSALADEACWGDDVPTAESLNLDRYTDAERKAFAKQIAYHRALLHDASNPRVVRNIEACERILAERGAP